ncbi:MAG: hypothetical protein LBJ18_00315 [Rickettsiales bacterium]|jgi:hypothetical protein|nr:hypothetical protein [Rickettsiales bacterium]
MRNFDLNEDMLNSYRQSIGKAPVVAVAVVATQPQQRFPGKLPEDSISRFCRLMKEASAEREAERTGYFNPRASHTL